MRKSISKYIQVLIVLGFVSMFSSPLLAQEDAIVKYFGKYVERDDFTSVYISPKMFRLIGAKKLTSENPNLDATLKKLNGLRILSADSVNGNALYEEIFSTLNTNSYEELMSVKEKDSDVKFLIKGEDEETVNELLMLVGGDSSFFMLSIIGVNLDINSVVDIANDLSPDSEEKDEEE